MKKEDKDANKAEFVVDLGIGGLFKGLTDMVGQLSNAVEDLNIKANEETGEFTIKGLDGEAKGVYGFSIRTASGGGTRVEPFGNIRKTKEGAEVAESREPMVDVFDEAQELIITAELPGVAENQIELAVEEDILSIQTTGNRKFAKEIVLPSAVDTDSMVNTYNNGILEIRFGKSTSQDEERTA